MLILKMKSTLKSSPFSFGDIVIPREERFKGPSGKKDVLPPPEEAYKAYKELVLGLDN